jgi:RNA 2',3'-cyclic 3'-phosphodiesterase
MTRSERAERGLMRIFVAVFPPPEVQRGAAALIEALRADGDGVSWVKSDNLHFTIRFLGDLGESGAGRAAAAVRAAAGRMPAFRAVLGEPGAFPSPRKARVLWLGLAEGGDRLVELARAVERGLEDSGFGRADRPFKPHLTIGRVRERERDWSEPLAAAAPPGGSDGAFEVDRVVVVQSTLSPKGSVYRVRDEAPLAR